MLALPPKIPQIKFKGVEDIIDKSCVLNFMPMQYGNKMIDLSGHNNHGVITGATQMHPPGSAIIFDGLDDKIDCLHPASIFLVNNFTWEMWFKPEDLTHNEILMSWYGERFGIRIRDNSGYKLTVRDYLNNDNIWGNTVLQAGQWYHLVVTKSSVTGTQIYLNGVSEGGDDTATGNTELIADNDLWLGMDKWAQENSWSDWFEGKMDEVRIYSRAITPTEAREHYEGKFTNETGLELHYTFYTQTGNTVYDLTANANNGTRTGACLTGDTLIKTETGFKRIDDMEANDIIYAYSKNGMVKEITRERMNQGEKTVYELSTMNRKIRASDNHPFLCVKFNGKKKVSREWNNSSVHQNDFSLEWKQLKDIKRGDLIVVQSENPLDNEKEFSVEFIRLVGAFLGDGSFHKRQKQRYNLDSYSIGFHLFDETLIKRYSDILNNHGIKHSEDGKVIHIYGREFGELLENLDLAHNVYNKRVPEFIWKLDLERKKALLEGIIDTDGWKVKRLENTYGVQLVNKQLLEGLRYLAIDCGYKVSNVVYTEPRDGGIIKGRQIHSNGSYSFNFTKNYKGYAEMRYGNREGEKQKRINLQLPKGFELQKVREIKEKGKETVYDLAIPNNHNFIANGIVVHNSWTTVGRPKPTYVLPTLYLDGVDDTSNLGQAFYDPNALTEEFWVYPILANEKNCVGGDHLDDGGNRGLDTIIMHGHFLRFEDANGYHDTANNTIKINQWNHIVVSGSSSQGKLRVYINGDLKNTWDMVYPISTQATNYYLGKRGGGGDWFKGLISEVRFLNKAISATQVKRLFEWRRADYGV